MISTEVRLPEDFKRYPEYDFDEKEWGKDDKAYITSHKYIYETEDGQMDIGNIVKYESGCLEGTGRNCEGKKVVAWNEIPAWIDADDEVPSDNRYILIHFSNFSVPMIGRYDGNEEEGYAFYIGDEFESTCIQEDLFVDFWMDIPGLEMKKC